MMRVLFMRGDDAACSIAHGVPEEREKEEE